MLEGPDALFFFIEEIILEISKDVAGVRKKDSGIGFFNHFEKLWRMGETLDLILSATEEKKSLKVWATVKGSEEIFSPIFSVISGSAFDVFDVIISLTPFQIFWTFLEFSWKNLV